MQVEPLTRRFCYPGLELPDLDPRLTPEQVICVIDMQPARESARWPVRIHL
jgi:PRTRC genetic system protein C